MHSQDMRRGFLKYFKDHGHTTVASSPVVPHDDPTLLFTNAGMNQFKDVFLGKSHRDYTRAATAQKCIRAGGKHNDLDNVGHTTRHLTFFEMLGNFSFGDYFKEQAIAYAWEVSTQVFGFDPAYIWITVFEKDDEAFELWQKHISADRIVRMGEKDNFWAMGDTGPCGPCSELYYDKGKKYGDARNPKEDASGERYLEFWNLVFMQFNRDSSGIMTPLPKQSIDTGAGLERVMSLKMGVDSVFATDIFRGLIAQIEQVTGKKYHGEAAFHVIADHIRSLSFAIADGAQPSNVERGYVLRKILRRASRYGRMLGMVDPFLGKVLPRLVELMGPDYKELVASQSRIEEILTLEEEAFLRTLKRGGNILNSVIEQAQKSPQKQIRGEEAFKLKDTYGLPLEEILLIAKDAGLQVNLESYELLEEQAKEKSRKSQTTHLQQAEENLFKEFVEKQGGSTFVGYTATEEKGKIIGIFTDGKFVTSVGADQGAIILLDKTPFYAEKGGQVGDKGKISHQKGVFTVSDCQAPFPGVIAHHGAVESGTLNVGDAIVAEVNSSERRLTENNHTATHLLHWALQKVLGPHIRQAGSLVDPTRLRFDFNHHKPVSPEELRQIEELVNEKIREDRDVSTYEISYDDAQKRTDIKQFFGEKYGKVVRVVDISYSVELCGGTHTARTGRIGLFRVVKESSIAAGVRRIEAVTGKAAEELMYHQEGLAHTAASLFKAPLEQLPEKLRAFMEEHKHLTQQVKTFKRAQLKEIAIQLSQKAKKYRDTAVIAEIVPVDTDELPLLAEDMLGLLGSTAIFLGIKSPEKSHLLIRLSSDLVKKGLNASAMIKELAPFIGGMGGGKPDMAQAGGKNPQGFSQAFDAAYKLIEKSC